MSIEGVSFMAAFFGGFSAFFSAWQLCIMQISPFFLAFAVGLYLVNTKGAKVSIPSVMSLLIAGTGFLITFSIFFGLLGTSGLGISRYLKYNLGTFKNAAGLCLLIIALLLIYKGVLRRGRIKVASSLLMGLFLGASLAVSYSPCITPVMSKVMNFSVQPGNAAKGFSLLTVYGAGMSIALIATGVVIALGSGYLFNGRIGRAVSITLSSFLLSVMSFMLLFGFMANYKALLVGMFMD